MIQSYYYSSDGDEEVICGKVIFNGGVNYELRIESESNGCSAGIGMELSSR